MGRGVALVPQTTSQPRSGADIGRVLNAVSPETAARMLTDYVRRHGVSVEAVISLAGTAGLTIEDAMLLAIERLGASGCYRAVRSFSN